MHLETPFSCSQKLSFGFKAPTYFHNGFKWTVLLPGQSPPLSIITSTDQSGVLLIVASLALIFALISMLIRIYLQLEVRHKVEPDDYAVFAAMVLFQV